MPPAILEKSNRGLLLDCTVIAANLLAFPVLSRAFLGVIHRAGAGDPAALAIIFAYCVALLVLAPLGATLKRWHYHRRRAAEGAVTSVTFDGAAGCLFNWIFYFCLVGVIVASVNSFVLQRIFGNRDPGGAVFVSSILLGLVVMSVHTWLVYQYFSPPKRPPRSGFMRSNAAEVLGDAALFSNMLLFQLVWSPFSSAGGRPPGSVGEALAWLAILFFVALLLYFPPRMFYLAEDIGKPRTWGMILAANAPVIYRVVAGSG